jgi:Protein of unknown function (DUF2800)
MNPTVNSAGQWIKCPASVQAQQTFPRVGDVSQSTLEGRACHELAQKMIGAIHGDPNAPLFGDLVGSLSKDGVLITQELFEAAREYVNDVLSMCGDNNLHIEKRVSLEDFLPEWWGVPDCYIYNDLDNHLTIWDAKFGHELVNAVENWPMMIYAMGLCRKLDLDNQCKITLRVVQPRGFHSGGTTREWSLSRVDLLIYEHQLKEVLKDVARRNPPAQVGSQCKYCTARSHCDTLSRVNYENIDYMNDLHTHNLTGHSLGVELKLLQRAKKMLDYRLSGLEEQAVHELKTGSHVSFFGVKEGTGRERWRKDVPTDQLIMMGNLMGVDIRKPVELDTPAQVRKKGIDETVIKEYSETPSTGLKLVKVDEKSIKSVFERG